MATLPSRVATPGFILELVKLTGDRASLQRRTYYGAFVDERVVGVHAERGRTGPTMSLEALLV